LKVDGKVVTVQDLYKFINIYNFFNADGAGARALYYESHAAETYARKRLYAFRIKFDLVDASFDGELGKNCAEKNSPNGTTMSYSYSYAMI